MPFGEETPKPVEFGEDPKEQMRESLNAIVTDMTHDFRADTSDEGKERYAKLLDETKDRLKRTAKKIDFPKAPGAYDDEVAKQLVWDVVQQDREIRAAAGTGQQSSEQPFSSVLKKAVSEVAKGTMSKEEMQSRMRMEMEKRLGLFIHPSEQEIDAALGNLEMKDQKTPETHENHDA